MRKINTIPFISINRNTNSIIIRQANIIKIFKCIKEDTHHDDVIIESFINELIKTITKPTEPRFDNLKYLIQNLIYEKSNKNDYKYYKYIWNFYIMKDYYLNGNY